MFGVLVVHITATPAVQLSPASSLYPVYILANRFGKVGTTTFVFLSSLVLFYNYFDRPLKGGLLGRFYRRRVLFVVLPYVVWSAFYYALNLVEAHGLAGGVGYASFAGLGQALLRGNAYYHLYFVVINIQFYLLFPAFLWLVKRLRGRGRGPGLGHGLLLAGILGQWAFYWFARHLVPLPYKSSIGLSYFSHYCLGAFAGLYYDRFVGLLEGRLVVLGRPIRAIHLLTLVWAGVGLSYAALYYQQFGFGVVHPDIWYELTWSAYTYLSIMMLVYWSRAIVRRGSARLVAALTQIGTVTFGIYLVHPLLLTLWQRTVAAVAFGSAPWAYHLTLGAGLMSVALLSWAIATAAHRWLPWSWVLLGPRPARAATASTAPERRP